MKVLHVILVLIVFMAVGCKTQKIAPKPRPVPVKSENVDSEPVTSEAAPAETAVRPGGITSTAKGKVERVSAAKGEANDLGSKRFYIIVGSFGVYENAQKFKKQLLAESFFPGILVNEAGLYRVCVNSFDDEDAARSKLGNIRQQYPKYGDAWLLIKK